MLLFEIVNPSDPYTMQADSFAAALLAVALIGEGKYGLRPIDNDTLPVVPPVIFGDWSCDVYAAAGAKGISELTKRANDEPEFNEAVASALDSVRIGSKRDRDESKESHDSRRSSMNNIGKYAWGYASALRGKNTMRSVDAKNPAVEV